MSLQVIKSLFGLCLFTTALTGGVQAESYYSGLDELPDVEELRHVSFETPMKIYTKDQKLIGEFGEHKRIPVTIDKIPLKMQQAFLAIEDTRFYQHSGVDPVGILRAVGVALTSGGASQGASTITQQVARNFFLNRDRTLERKVKEMFIAWRMEQVLSKEEILELYLNKIALGHRSYGVVAAAQTYYGKKLDELTLAEIATIAGLPKAPSTLNPITSPKRAKDRRHLVLLRMLTLGYITPAEFMEADNAPSKATFHSAPLEAYAPYVAEEARQYVLNNYGEESYTNGIKVYTTVDSEMQHHAHNALFTSLMDYEKRHGYRGPLMNLYDDTRGHRGKLHQIPDRNGQGANDNNGIILTARAQLIEQYKHAPQQPTYPQVVAAIDNSSYGNAIARTQWSTEQILDILYKEDRYRDLHPAFVLSVDQENKSAQLLNPQGEEQTLTWEGMQWARAFITDRKQGAEPTYPGEFLLEGDIIFTRVEHIPATRKEAARDVLHLSQVPEVEGALIALNPKDGAIRAMIGGFDFEKSKFNRTTQLLRQTGSNFKPFIYSSAIAYGLALNSVLPDAPIKTWDAGSMTWWEPRNSPNRFEGPMTLRQGLAKSKNSISIRTIRRVGVFNVVKHLEKFGIFVPKFQQSESMALGSMELTPLQVATAYSSFSNGGYKLSPYLIERIESRDGTVLYQANPPLADIDSPDIIENAIPMKYVPGIDPNLVEARARGEFLPQGVDHPIAPQILSHGHAYLVASLMHSVIYGGHDLQGEKYWGTGYSAYATTLRNDLYGKTGTTNNVHDAWFSGFNGDLTCTTWVGFDNDRNLGFARGKGSESGGATALPIFARFFRDALKDSPEAPLAVPPGMRIIKNRGITELALPGMYAIDDAGGSRNLENTGIDTSTVQDGGDIF